MVMRPAHPKRREAEQKARVTQGFIVGVLFHYV
jgi:hypothetical protein